MDLKIGVHPGSKDDRFGICLVQRDPRLFEPAKAVDLIKLLLEEDLEGEKPSFNRWPVRSLEIGETDYHFLIRCLESLPSTSMGEVSRRLNKIVDLARTHGYKKDLELYLNVTGKQDSLLDYFRDTLRGCSVNPFRFALGVPGQLSQRHGLPEQSGLFLKLSQLLESGNLHFDRRRDSEQLAADLLTFEPSLEPLPEQLFKFGAHNELVMAISLTIHGWT